MYIGSFTLAGVFLRPSRFILKIAFLPSFFGFLGGAGGLEERNGTWSKTKPRAKQNLERTETWSETGGLVSFIFALGKWDAGLQIPN